MTDDELETLGADAGRAVDAVPPISVIAIAGGHGFSCLPRLPDGQTPRCRWPAIFYDSIDEREREFESARVFARHKLAERGEPNASDADVDHLARAMFMPREFFVPDARECRGDIDALAQLHCFAPRRLIEQRLAELVETRLRIVEPPVPEAEDADAAAMHLS